MHTALVSRLLRDKSLWEPTTIDAVPPGEPLSPGQHVSV
jgi:hypothetical protein